VEFLLEGSPFYTAGIRGRKADIPAAFGRQIRKESKEGNSESARA